MKILLIGSGGREHALAWKISASKHCEQLFIAPGNPGTGACGKNISIGTTDFKSLADFVYEEKITLVIVGPEEPLVKGIVDFFKADDRIKDVGIVGPSKAGAQLEGSKDFSKLFMKRHGIPTAEYETFTKETFSEGIAFLKTLKAPYVLKADGLAAGKGVVIPHDLETAEKELKDMLLDSRFGIASEKVVIEEFLPGIEISVFVLLFLYRL